MLLLLLTARVWLTVAGDLDITLSQGEEVLGVPRPNSSVGSDDTSLDCEVVVTVDCFRFACFVAEEGVDCFFSNRAELAS